MEGPLSAQRRCASVCALLGLVALAPSAALGWGDAGHRIVARGAEPYLSSTARRRVEDLLGASECGGRETLADAMACAATWADRAREDSHRQTYNWHFVDISLGTATYDARRDCRPRNRATKGTCVVDGLDHVVGVLRGARSDPTITRAQALMFVIHLVADLHQPLHTVRQDMGGNFTYVRYFDARANLHQVWDTRLLQTAMRRHDPSERSYARRLGERIAVDGLATWQRGGPVAWVEEAHRVAVDDAYGALAMSPKTRDGYPSLGDAYVARCEPIVERQLARAAARLAKVLNAALG